MYKPVNDFLSEIKVGARQSHHNMTLYCLLCAREAAVDFLTMDEALEQDLLVVTEVTEGGSVPELRVRNRADRKVLMLDGEELVGAKQNRVLNATILLAPQSETIIPVSCVEQGRWSYRSPRFGSEARAMSAYLRNKKAETVTMNLRRGERFRSDQGEVWREIEGKYERMSARRSPTMAMADLYESCRESTADYLPAFHVVSNQVGMAVFIDGVFAALTFWENSAHLKRPLRSSSIATSWTPWRPRTKGRRRRTVPGGPLPPRSCNQPWKQKSRRENLWPSASIFVSKLRTSMALVWNTTNIFFR
jgi:hypothetical protein